MEKKKLFLIYDMVVNDEKITDESLRRKGYTDEEIKFLFDDDRLYEVEEGKYFITYTTDLLDYAKNFMAMRIKSKYDVLCMKKALDKCLIFEPNDFEILAASLYNYLSVLNNNYDVNKILEIIDKMKEVATPNQLVDANYYYFLVNQLIDLPEKRAKKAKYIKYQDILLNPNDTRYTDIKTRNKIRKNGYSQKYTIALQGIRNVKDKTNANFIYDEVLHKLFFILADKKRAFVDHIANLAEMDEISEIIRLYNEKDKKTFLTTYDFYNLKLAVKYKEIIDRGIYPEVEHKHHTTIQSAIDDNDFDDALELCFKESIGSKGDITKTPRYILLRKLSDAVNNKNDINIKVKKDNRNTNK